MNIDVTTYRGIATATVNGHGCVSQWWPLALACAALKYWRSKLAICLSAFIVAIFLMPLSHARAQEIVIAYSLKGTGIDTLFKISHVGEHIKTDTLYFFAPATWLHSKKIFHPIREHYFSVANIEALQSRIEELESGWKNALLYQEFTKAHDKLTANLRQQIHEMQARIDSLSSLRPPDLEEQRRSRSRDSLPAVPDTIKSEFILDGRPIIKQ